MRGVGGVRCGFVASSLGWGAVGRIVRSPAAVRLVGTDHHGAALLVIRFVVRAAVSPDFDLRE
ncbi:hypothetical protein GCM10027444_24380 [Actinopolyspora lacussalsi]